MNRIVRQYLRLAPWELFVLLVVVPVVARLLADVPLEPEPGEPAGPLWYDVFMVMWFPMLSGWFWSIGIGTNRRVEEDLRPGSVLFNIAIVYPVLFLLVVTWQYSVTPEGEPSGGEMAAVGISSLLFLAAVGYTIRFVAKNLWLAEQGRDVKFRHYGGTLFLLMFYPVALWFVQPRVRKVCAEEVASGGE